MKMSETMSQIFDPMKLFEKLELARSFVQKDRRELTNQRIVASLKKIGIATVSEMKSLEGRLEKLESELRRLKKQT